MKTDYFYNKANERVGPAPLGEGVDYFSLGIDFIQRR